MSCTHRHIKSTLSLSLAWGVNVISFLFKVALDEETEQQEAGSKGKVCVATIQRIGVSLLFVAIVPLVLPSVVQAQPQLTIAELKRDRTPSEANLIYVNPRKGNDLAGDGSERSPFQTITHALKVARPQTAILLAPGKYSIATREKFPLRLKKEVKLQGSKASKGYKVIIEGNGFFISPTAAGQNATIVASHQAGGLTGVTVTNPHPRGHGLWIESASPQVSHNTFTRNGNAGVSVNGNSAPTIANNYFFNNGGNGLLVYGSSKPLVRNNEFKNTGFGVSAIGNAAPRLENNRISGNRIGVILQGNARATLRKNVIENSTEHGLVAISQSRADLGTAAQPGGNTFRGNRLLDIQNLVPGQAIAAHGNQLSGSIEGIIDLGNSVSNSRLRSRPLSASTSGETIVIPVPQPQENSDSLPVSSEPLSSQRPLPKPKPIGQNQATPIATTPSQSKPQPLPTRSSRSSSKQDITSVGDLVNVSPNSSPNSNNATKKLPVPDVPIPEGNLANLGHRARVKKSRHRVIVALKDANQEAIVRSLYPDSFSTVYQGKSMLQVGVFSSLENAEKTWQSLNDLGLNAMIVD